MTMSDWQNADLHRPYRPNRPSAPHRHPSMSYVLMYPTDTANVEMAVIPFRRTDTDIPLKGCPVVRWGRLVVK